MATSPTWVGSPKGLGVKLTAANTKSNGDGTIGTDIFVAFTAGASGSYIKNLIFRAVATTAGTASSATVFRVYLSTATSGATTGGTDTFLIDEISGAAQTADSATVATYAWVSNLERYVPPGYTILVSTHAAPAANTQFQAIPQGGDF